MGENDFRPKENFENNSVRALATSMPPEPGGAKIPTRFTPGFPTSNSWQYFPRQLFIVDRKRPSVAEMAYREGALLEVAIAGCIEGESGWILIESLVDAVFAGISLFSAL
jgi:hypothetical protein